MLLQLSRSGWELDFPFDSILTALQRGFDGKYSTIPPHSRWQHFDIGGHQRVERLIQLWSNTTDAKERTRRLLDLFLLSVLLDAGAGNQWRYKSQEGEIYSRSEGLAVASLEMFKAGSFSSVPDQPFQVDAKALGKINARSLGDGMQVTDSNPMSGLEGRAGLLNRLSEALSDTKYFGFDGRPGGMIGKS